MNPSTPEPANGNGTPAHEPYVPASQSPHEFTLPAIITGAVLGIIFGASSLYLLLRVGMTVSASVPIAVLSITLFRFASTRFGFRQATILENNIVQTTGSAGESIAFGVGVTMPALLLLGFEMEPIRVMTVSILGAVLGILMMIPLRRAFIVAQHGKLKYPEGTACAEVLVAGEKGGASARMVFIGFGIAAVYKFFSSGLQLWSKGPDQNLYIENDDGTKTGLKGANVSGDLSPELLGVGYLLGPRIASLMMAGAVLSFFVLGPMIATFGEGVNEPIAPAVWVDRDKGDPPRDIVIGVLGSAQQRPSDDLKNPGLIRNMAPGDIYENYLRYIGAGAVAAGGIIGMLRALPLIIGSIGAGFRDLRANRGGGGTARTERDIPMTVVFFGCLALAVVLAAVPQLGLGFNLQGILGAVMILLFGFLFVTVSSRLTGEVGSSSNPISGMTIATLLLTCLVFVLVGKRDVTAMLTAMSVAAVVCIASSNGGTTSQDLKTGYLVGATPKFQQYAILAGSLTSAVVIGLSMLALNSIGTHYVKRDFGDVHVAIPPDAPRQKVGKPYADRDSAEYFVVAIRKADQDRDEKLSQIKVGRYLADTDGRLVYWIDTPIRREYKKMDNPDDPTKEVDAPEKFKAPQPQLFAIIDEGVLTGRLEWSLVILGVLVAIMLELMGISSLPVAVGMYLGLDTAVPIFIGGMLRLLTDRWRGTSASEAQTETSPGVLLASGYIAGGTLVGLLLGFMNISQDLINALNLGQHIHLGEDPYPKTDAFKLVAVGMFLILAMILLRLGSTKDNLNGSNGSPEERPRET